MLLFVYAFLQTGPTLHSQDSYVYGMDDAKATVAVLILAAGKGPRPASRASSFVHNRTRAIDSARYHEDSTV